jgi:hypothetical protein
MTMTTGLVLVIITLIASLIEATAQTTQAACEVRGSLVSETHRLQPLSLMILSFVVQFTQSEPMLGCSFPWSSLLARWL